jgi:hypothetical protein
MDYGTTLELNGPNPLSKKQASKNPELRPLSGPSRFMLAAIA